jgi:RHS repeat-associated protein
MVLPDRAVGLRRSCQYPTNRYNAGGQRVAERVLLGSASTLYYLHGDHLGSTSLVTCGTLAGCGAVAYGAVVARRYYYPFGEERPGGTGTLPTTYGFTGQRRDSTGLIYLNARYYDELLGRFISADTIVPGSGNPQAFNRYAYVFNNPLKYVDPTGHCAFNAARDQITQERCSVDDFAALSWEDRQLWLKLFVEQYGLGDWFNDIKYAIGYMASQPNLQDENGWAYYMDAAVLQAINDGMQISRGNMPVGSGGAGWAIFFASLSDVQFTGGDESSLIGIRLDAEGQGVRYAESLPESRRRYAAASDLDQIHIDLFLGGADAYRDYSPAMRAQLPTFGAACGGHVVISCMAYDTISSATDPRTSQGALSVMSILPRPVAWVLHSLHVNANRTPLQ